MNCCSGYEDFALVRYNIDGSLDTSFGTDGRVNTDIGGAGDIAYAVKVQPDGKIVVAGTANDRFALARYNPNGMLDGSFGTGGIVQTGFGGSFEVANALGLQTDGEIVAVGTKYLTGGSGADFALARYTASGTLDTSFGSGGKVTTSISVSDAASGAVIQPADGKIIAAGSTYDPNVPTGDAALVRYNTNGSLDTSFNSTGIVVTDLGGSDDAFASVVLQADNKIAVTGRTGAPSAYHFGLARYTTSGALDSGFGTGGIVTTSFADNDEASSILLQSNGKLVASGTINDNNLWPHVAQGVARYNTDGTLDPTFGTAGKAVTQHLRSNALAAGIAIQGDGKIVAAGTASNNIALARYDPNGTLDSGFGTGGMVTTTTSLAPILTANGLTLQSDGKIVTVGIGFGDTGRNLALARYNTERYPGQWLRHGRRRSDQPGRRYHRGLRGKAASRRQVGGARLRRLFKRRGGSVHCRWGARYILRHRRYGHRLPGNQRQGR